MKITSSQSPRRLYGACEYESCVRQAVRPAAVQVPPAAVAGTQAERVALLEALQQIPLKLRTSQQPLIFAYYATHPLPVPFSC